jgi:hypothetical protein
VNASNPLGVGLTSVTDDCSIDAHNQCLHPGYTVRPTYRRSAAAASSKSSSIG